jgi:hypothetical protein
VQSIPYINEKLSHYFSACKILSMNFIKNIEPLKQLFLAHSKTRLHFNKMTRYTKIIRRNSLFSPSLSTSNWTQSIPRLLQHLVEHGMIKNWTQSIPRLLQHLVEHGMIKKRYLCLCFWYLMLAGVLLIYHAQCFEYL